jgi:hypothetical protein
VAKDNNNVLLFQKARRNNSAPKKKIRVMLEERYVCPDLYII